MAITLGVTAVLEVSSRKHEDARRWRNDLRDLYADFLRLAALYDPGEDDDLLEDLLKEIGQARDRIALLGSKEVYEAALSFMPTGSRLRHLDTFARCRSDMLYNAWLKIAAAMRKEFGSRSQMARLAKA